MGGGVIKYSVFYILCFSGDNSPSFEALIDTAFQSDSTPSTTKPFIIVTTYDSVRINQNILMRRKWCVVFIGFPIFKF